MAQGTRECSRCRARLARDQRGSLCSPCRLREVSNDEPAARGAEFWQQDSLQDALRSQHFGRVILAYRNAHLPSLPQKTVGRWLGMTQAQISRMERAVAAPSDLRKLQRWASILRLPTDALWFAAQHAPSESSDPGRTASLDDVQRREMMKLTGAAAVAVSTGILNDAPWQRLAESLAGRRPADSATVGMIESRTAEFFRSEETSPARQLVSSLRTHYQSLRSLISTTADDTLRRRLTTSAGETLALAAWTFFDLQRPREAERLYQDAVRLARDTGDRPLMACILGYWSYLLSSNGNVHGAVNMLSEAVTNVRGSAATTQAWISARRAEEQASIGEKAHALRSLEQAVTVFDYATPGNDRPWTSFFTPSRLGSLAVSTYGRMVHPETEQAATVLLASLTPAENKVKAIALADLATSALHAGDYDHVQSLSRRSVDVAVRTETSLAIDRLWAIVEILPNRGTAGETKMHLTERLMDSA